MAQQHGFRLRMFGSFTAEYNGIELKLDKSGTTKVAQLLAMLIYFRDGIQKSTLLNNLYGDSNLSDRNNNLRVTIFKLRKLLREAGLPEAKYVDSKGGIYRWSCGVPISCDVWEFEEFLQQATEARNAGDVDREILCRQNAFALYTDEFLSRLSLEDWVVVEAVPLKNVYTDSLIRLCSILNQHKRYTDVEALCAAAESIYPYDEWQLLRVDALMAQEKYEEAMAVYQNYVNRCFEELNLSPTANMLKRYQKLSEKIRGKFSSPEELYRDLEESRENVKGASYVSYVSFIDRFRFLQRISERTGDSNFLVVVSPSLRRNGEPVNLNAEQGWADEMLRSILRKSLRRTDSFTRYNESQYLLLLVGLNLDSVKIVSKRIDQRLLRMEQGRQLQCSYRAIPMRQTDMSGEKPCWELPEIGGSEL